MNRRGAAGAFAAAALGALAACDNMEHQRNATRTAGPVVKPAPAHTVARDDPDPNDPALTGFRDGRELQASPVAVTAELLTRGRERFEIYCTPCHGADGYGAGIVVRRGFPSPPSFHQDRLRSAPDGHVFDVITRGYGVMLPYGARIAPADRWAIVSYLRALQKSQWEPVATLPPSDRAHFGSP